MKYIDMHCHTIASDGSLNPTELVNYALEKGLNGIAVTDHDTVGGIKEAVEYSKSIKDFYCIPGIEISSEFLGQEVHILGYAINPDFEELNTLLEEMRVNRESRSVKMIQKLNDIGFEITYEEVRSLAKGVVGRPHIGQVLIQKGYVKNMHEVFSKYLKLGGVAYVPRFKITPLEAITIIKKSGGVPVLAHPGYIKNKEIIEKVISYGIGGIEVYYPTHEESQIDYFNTLAMENNIIVTGGSDFHSIPNEKNNRYDLGTSKILLNSIAKILELV
ncbi:PHP domain-containing protein [Serpentinicella alkaliphila]|uniref:Polymerase/histidinol phosphatase N-terminal domain-containing protein n=1 Tax=Serpentinicella alkaliphila TaxID=1734049 RepID=A0A4R2T1P1_9FIRM|nr:PHP domain-containing protein [Serpentinicella alkaliphila]QUH26346.1 PHP domain-containing protein [Serpentinicella alkaliphila]TCP96799.1 hypothetical protein EDD79_104916 [Serpentinicella alkaliphila]